MMRIVPYRTIDNVIDGVVITFLNITEQKKSADTIGDLSKSVQLNREYADIVDTLREPIIVLDSDLKVFLANNSFYRFFKVTASETVGQYIYDLGNRQWDIPALRKLLESVIPTDEVVKNFEVAHQFKNIGQKKMLVNARKITPVRGKKTLVLLTFDEDAAAYSKK
jgi:PAS domain-containing protein